MIIQPYITICLAMKLDCINKVVGFNSVSLLNKNNFKDLYPFIYFDLSALKEPEAKLSFYYELNNETTVDYTIYAIVLHEKSILT